MFIYFSGRTQQAIFRMWRRFNVDKRLKSRCDVGYSQFNITSTSYFRRHFNKKKRIHYNVVPTSCLKRCWNQVEIPLQLRWNHVEIMTLKQISYETFFQRRFDVSLLFFNVVSTLKQRRCACWEIFVNLVFLIPAPSIMIGSTIHAIASGVILNPNILRENIHFIDTLHHRLQSHSLC